ncbi:hypothetical protein INT43_004683 [Umbelopsis isabellina]|uniref:MFS general substrate transporter n=1 Tax=Mortierella isabellina TaxID=91625 RepID=A0A8H7PG21_MORIS|nr:hypothetical protein INT43_004683 [Umbelopsis isabellina]
MRPNFDTHQPASRTRPQSLTRSYSIHGTPAAGHSNDIQVTPPSPTLSSCTVAVDTAYELKTYPQAWIALFLLVCLRAGSAVFQYTFAPIPAVTAEYFGVSLSAINWLSNIQGLIYVFLSFFTGWIFEKLGVKKSLILAGFILSLGCWIRWFAVLIHPPSFAITMIGQVIAASAAPLALNIMSMFQSLWFTDNLRATAGMFVASNYGAILGMFMIPAVATGKDNIPLTLIIVAGIATAGFVPLIFMPAKPKTPPTYAQATDRPPFFEGLKMLSKNGHYWILFLIHGINVGLSMALATIFNQVITPYGYTNAQSGQLSAVSFFAGTLGCSVAGPVLDMTKQHKLFLRLMAPLTLATYIGFIFIIKKDSFAAIMFTSIMNQFFLSFLVPVVVELGVEVSYPVAESTSNSMLWQGCQLFGFIFVLIMDQMRDPNGDPKDNMRKALILQAALMGLCTIFAFVYNGRNRRTEAMEEERLQREEDEKAMSILEPPRWDRERSGSVCSEQSDATRVEIRDLEKQKGKTVEYD